MVQKREIPKPPRMEIDDIARLWIISKARENYWRVAAYIDFDDLIQWGFFDWYRIASGQMEKGPRKPGEPVSAMHSYKYITSRPHIMSLFQRAYINRINDLANKRTSDAPFNEAFEDYMDAPDDENTTVTALAETAPEPVQKVLSIFMTEEGRTEMAKPYAIVKGHRETTNERLRRLTGLAGNIASVVKAHFLGDTIAKPSKLITLQDPYTALRKQGKTPVEALAFTELKHLAQKIAEKRGDSLRGKAAAVAIACGKLLQKAKEICHKTGISFLSWVQDTCSFCASTARKYMWLARLGDGMDNMKFLSLAGARRFLLSV